MKRSRIFNPLMALVLLIAFCAVPLPVSATQPQMQTGTTITATGQTCDPSGTYCYPMQLSFDPAGGPVTGSFGGSLDLSGPGYTATTHFSGSLDGTFKGGDGGAVSGTISGHDVGTVSIPGFPDQSATQDWTGTWEGTLRADGTGNGTVSTFPQGVNAPPGAGIWSVTFSADEFQAGLNAGKITPEYIQETYGITVESGDKDWSDHELQLLNDVLKNLPPSFRDKLALQNIVRYESSWDATTGKLDPNTFGDYSPVDQRAGFDFARSAQTIRIYDRATQPFDFNNDTGDIEFKATVLHEMTHALQFYNNGQDPYKDPYNNSPLMHKYYFAIPSGTNVGWFSNRLPSGQLTWKYVSDTGNDPPTAYGLTNPLEDMSESVMMYVYDPQKLENSSVQRYNFIRDNIFGGIEYANGKQK